MSLFYAERLGDPDRDEPYIAESAVFTSIEEFLPYRLKGWTGSDKTNAAADAMLSEHQPDEGSS